MLAVPADSAAQLNGQNIKGDAGLKSGSQAPPGTYVAIPLWFYTADEVKDGDGDEFLAGSLDAALFGAALNVVTAQETPRRQLRVPRRAALGEQPPAGRR
jgi:hypothetical protein